jgi:DNA-binding LytR/AlgR family response regulator
MGVKNNPYLSNMTTRVGIVEDELLVADSIADALTDLGYEALEPVISYTEALFMITTEKPDILLLDIQLSGKKDGIELAEKINQDFNIPFIFLTANSDAMTIERAKKVNPPAYLVKPFSKDSLYTSIEICLHNFSKRTAPVIEQPDNASYLVKDSVFIKQNNVFQKVKIEDILYLESDKNYIYVHTIDNKYWVRNSLQGFVDLTNSPKFLRIHKGFIINVGKVTSVSAESVFLNKVEVPLSRSFKDELLGKLIIS